MTRARRRPVTADQLMARLEADPEFVVGRAAQDDERKRKQAILRRAEAPLVAELRGAGFDVSSAWDLVNTKRPGSAALPILLAHLGRPHPDRVREVIARALAVRDSLLAWHDRTRLYRDEDQGTDAKDGLAAAIAAVSNDDVIDDLIALAGDPEHGTSRVLLLTAVARSKAPQARTALERLAKDPQLAEEVKRLPKRTN